MSRRVIDKTHDVVCQWLPGTLTRSELITPVIIPLKPRYRRGTRVYRTHLRFYAPDTAVYTHLLRVTSPLVAL